METNTSSENNTSMPVDDGYWDSLIQQENDVASEIPNLNKEYTDSDSSQMQFQDAIVSPSLNESWKQAQELKLQDETVTLFVTGHNKGGLLVSWEGLQGFIPASQLLNLPDFHMKAKREQALADREGSSIEVKIIEINPSNNRLIFSERAAEVDAGSKEQLMYGIRKGEILKGHVTNLADFGAFVDLGGIEGLIHLSQLSWARIEHPGDVVKPGEEVEVLVLQIDKQKERVALSLKQVNPDPWLSVEENYTPGQFVTGTVKSIKGYGAFVELSPGLEGLIHVSELAEGTFFHANNVVSEGEQVTARVLKVDAKRKRLSLSLKSPSPS